MFEVILRPPAERYYNRQTANTQQRLNKAIDRLEKEPRFGSGIRRLEGPLAGLHRIQVGSLRVIFRVHETKGRVEVLAIGPRGDVYRSNA